MILGLTACSAPSSAHAAVVILPNTATRTANPPTLTATMTTAPTATATATMPMAALTATATPDLKTISRLAAYLNGIRFNGSVFVAQGGQILISQGYGEADRAKKVLNTAQTKYRIASLTKQFTAMAVLILQAQGKLNVQDKACDYMQSCPKNWEKITIHQLLTHTSGLPNYMELSNWGSFHAKPASPADLMRRFSQLPLDFKPGTKWSYSNSGYVVLGSIIEQVSGTSYQAFLKESIFDPLNMTASGYLGDTQGMALGYAGPQSHSPADLDDTSVLYAAGGLHSSVEDLYRWDQALFTDKLIQKNLREKIFASYMPVPYPAGFGYGYGWMIGEIAGHKVVSHTGRVAGYSSHNAYYPDDQVAVILLGNQDNEPVETIATQLAKIVFAGK